MRCDATKKLHFFRSQRFNDYSSKAGLLSETFLLGLSRVCEVSVTLSDLTLSDLPLSDLTLSDLTLSEFALFLT